jgi:hypothetical protein
VPSTGYSCVACSNNTGYVVLIIILVLLAAALAYVMHELVDVGSLSDASTAAGAHTSHLAKLKALPWSKLRTPVVVYQILTQFVNITGLQMPDLYKDFLAWIDVINLNIGWTFSVGCVTSINFYNKLLVTTLTPLVLTGILFLTYKVACHRSMVIAFDDNPTAAAAAASSMKARTHRLEKVRARHRLAFLVMTFLIYATVSTTVFQTFACDNTKGLGGNYLRADYSIQCDTTTHTLYRLYAAVMILVYPLGTPAAYGYLLWTHRHQLRNLPVTDTNTTATDTTNGVDDDDVEASESLVEDSKNDDNADLQSIGFLWQAYRPQMFYWELIECLRRLLLTGAIVFIYPNTTTQAAVACLLALVSMAVVAAYSPHKEATDKRVYITGSAIIFLSMFLALLIKANVNEADTRSQKAYSALLVLLNVAIVVIALAQMFLAGRASYVAAREQAKTKSAKCGPSTDILNAAPSSTALTTTTTVNEDRTTANGSNRV